MNFIKKIFKSIDSIYILGYNNVCMENIYYKYYINRNSKYANKIMEFLLNATLPNICSLIGIKWYNLLGVPVFGYVINEKK